MCVTTLRMTDVHIWQKKKRKEIMRSTEVDVIRTQMQHARYCVEINATVSWSEAHSSPSACRYSLKKQLVFTSKSKISSLCKRDSHLKWPPLHKKQALTDGQITDSTYTWNTDAKKRETSLDLSPQSRQVLIRFTGVIWAGRRVPELRLEVWKMLLEVISSIWALMGRYSIRVPICCLAL